MGLGYGPWVWDLRSISFGFDFFYSFGVFSID